MGFQEEISDFGVGKGYDCNKSVNLEMRNLWRKIKYNIRTYAMPELIICYVSGITK